MSNAKIKIFSASVMFDACQVLDHYPVVTTDTTSYKTLDGFLDFCELTAKENSLFSIANVFINAMECQILEDGTIQKIKTAKREFRNRDPVVNDGV